jgi:hypothetical protein
VNDYWGRPWVWGSVIVLVLVLVGMYAVGSRYYMNLRKMLVASEGRPAISEQDLAAYLNSRVPDALGGIGALGLLVLIWLMVLKPG